MKKRKSSTKMIAEYQKVLLKNKEKKKTFYAMNTGALKAKIQVIKMALFLDKIVPRDKQIVFVCIGTSALPGDCIGPSVGYLLARASDCITVYGKPSENVNATNVNAVAEMLREKHKDDFIVAIDAAVSQTTEAGNIVVCDKPVKPAAAILKATGLADIGEVSILAITSSTCKETEAIAPGADMVKVMPDFIAHSLLFFVQHIRKERIISVDINPERKPFYK